MSEAQDAYLADLTSALAEAKDQLKSTTSMLASRGERSKAEELADVERLLIDAEISVSKNFLSNSEQSRKPVEKAA